MEENSKQYTKYKPRFKQICIMEMVSGILSLITTLFIIFVPCFKIKETILGLVVGLEMNFSIFDEILLLFRLISSTDGSQFMFMMSIMCEVLAMVHALILIVLVIMNCVKMIGGVMNIDSYSLIEYDKLKRRDVVISTPKFSIDNKYLSLFLSFIIFLIMGIIFNSVLKGLASSSDSPMNEPTSYFASMNDVTAGLYFAVIFVVAVIVLYTITSVLKQRIKTDILMNEYQIKETAEEKPQE